MDKVILGKKVVNGQVLNNFKIRSLVCYATKLLMSIGFPVCWLFGIIILSIIAFGCDNQFAINQKIDSKYDSLKISCVLKELKVKTFENTQKRFFLYGNLIIENTSNQASKYFLEELHLKYKDQLSSKAYIDSVASFVLKPEKVASKEKVKFNIYWVFETEIKPKDFSELKLIVIK